MLDLSKLMKFNDDTITRLLGELSDVMQSRASDDQTEHAAFIAACLSASCKKVSTTFSVMKMMTGDVDVSNFISLAPLLMPAKKVAAQLQSRQDVIDAIVEDVHWNVTAAFFQKAFGQIQTSNPAVLGGMYDIMKKSLTSVKTDVEAMARIPRALATGMKGRLHEVVDMQGIERIISESLSKTKTTTKSTAGQGYSPLKAESPNNLV